MAVVIQYLVMRNGVEKLKTCDKKVADQHDKMLDVADNIAQLISRANLHVDENTLEDIGVLLSKNKEAVSALFRGKTLSEIEDSLLPLNDPPSET